jgi:pilus assembly protein Flp/PilA
MRLNSLILVYLKFQNLLNREEGQDLVEYALIITLIALAAVTGIGKVATAVNTVFSKISTTLA